MEPNQDKKFYIIVISSFLIIILVIIFFVWKKNHPQKEKVVESPLKTVSSSYKTSKIENLTNNFKILKFPNTNFVLTAIKKIDDIRPQACGYTWPKEVTDQIKISNSCWDPSMFDPDIAYSLVGVNLRVENNGFDTVQGDLIKLGYITESQSKEVLRFAQRDMDFTSYAVSEAQERFIQLSFWVPTEETNKLYLLYGGVTNTDYANQTPKSIKSFDGALEIDFTESKVTPVDTKLVF